MQISNVNWTSKPIDPKKLAKQFVILLAEAAIFGIGIEVGKDLYKLVRRRGSESDQVAAAAGAEDALDDGAGI